MATLQNTDTSVSFSPATEQAALDLQETLTRTNIKANVGSEGTQVHVLTDSQGARDLARCLKALDGAMKLLESAIEDMRKPMAPAQEEEPSFAEMEIDGRPHTVALTSTWISVLDSEGVCVDTAEFVAPLKIGGSR